MTIKLEKGFKEVTITVKDKYSTESEEYDTLSFLNYLSLVAREAQMYHDKEYGVGTFKSRENLAHELFEFCMEHGLYK